MGLVFFISNLSTFGGLLWWLEIENRFWTSVLGGMFQIEGSC